MVRPSCKVIMRHVMALAYYACLARTVIGMVYILNKARNNTNLPSTKRTHEALSGDVRMFFLSLVRHSPVFEHMATVAWGSKDREAIVCVYVAVPPAGRHSMPIGSSCSVFYPLHALRHEHRTNGIPQTPRHARYPTFVLPSQPGYAAKRTDRLVCALWPFSGHVATQLRRDAGVPQDLSVAQLPLALDNLFAVPNSK